MRKANDLPGIKHLNGVSTVVQSAAVRWTLTLAWSAVAVWLMLSPGTKGGTVSNISHSFGGTEITDAIGHVIINAILAFLWSWTLSLYVPKARITRLILIGGIVWGVSAELSQLFVPERGTSLLDLTANIIGVTIGVLVYRVVMAISPKRSQPKRNAAL